MKTSVVLVSPKGAGNVGGVARLLGNFGIEDLRIVEPRCDLLCSEAKMMAMASFDILQSAQIYPTLADALSDQTFSIGFSGRRVDDGRPKHELYGLIQNLHLYVRPDEKVALIFGREEWGLRLEELDQCNTTVEIPTSESKSSMNLSSAVAVALSFFHEFVLRKPEERPLREIERPTRGSEEVFFKRLEVLLQRIKFVNPQNPKQNLDDLRAVFHRADLSDRELRILFGVLTGVEKSLDRKKSFQSFDEPMGAKILA